MRQWRAVLSVAIRSLEDRGICAQAVDSIIALFNKSSFEDKMKELDRKHAVGGIQEYVPSWYKLMRPLFATLRAYQLSYSKAKEECMHKRLFAVTGILCFSQAQQKCNTFSSRLDPYLQNSGVSR